MTQPNEQREQVVQGPQTNIDRDVYGLVLSGRFEGPVNVYSRSQLEELEEYLARAVAAYEARMYQRLRPLTAPPNQPYKFLYAFEIEDAPIFFGRKAASAALHKTVLQDRMTVLHARSGAGKTSLLKAGFAPRLIREGRLPVYARAYEDPVLAIKRAIATPSGGPWPELLDALSLHAFLGLVCQHLSRDTQELVIILDQFEEFFVFCPALDHRRPFAEALTSCYEDTSLPVRIIIGIRGDYFTQLATFQDCLPHIFHNEYYMGTMTREETQAAITGPVARLDRAVTYEHDLLDTLLDDLARGGVELPHLQIICTQLYAGLSKDGTTISLAAYETLGGAEGILGGYLNGVLDKLPPGEQTLAKEVLKELVSSEATKRVLPYDRLQKRLGVEPGELSPVLAYLVDERLLQRDQDGPLYEMAHEYLIGEIETWIDQESLAFKQIQELLEREVTSWRVHNTLIPRDRLEMLYTQRDRFNQLSEEAWECIIDSALHADFAVEEWAEIAGERAVNSLLKSLYNPDKGKRKSVIRDLAAAWDFQELRGLAHTNSQNRARAANKIGELGDIRAVKPLIAVLGDEDSDVRRGVVEALGSIGDARAIASLVAVLSDEDSNVRREAIEALGCIADVRTVEPLINVLGDEDKAMRWRAAHALGKIGDERAVAPLIAVIGDEDGNVRQEAVNALGKIGDARAVVPLIAVLDNEDKAMRQGATIALGSIGRPAVAQLIALLSSEDKVIRRGAVNALRKAGDERAVKPLIASLGDEDRYVRRGAAHALGGIGEPAMASLIVLLSHEDENTRQGAAIALGKIGNARAVSPLITVLGNEDKDMCRSAIYALVHIGGPAVAPLIALLDDEDENVRRNAAYALKQIGTPEALAALDDDQC